MEHPEMRADFITNALNWFPRSVLLLKSSFSDAFATSKLTQRENFGSDKAQSDT